MWKISKDKAVYPDLFLFILGPGLAIRVICAEEPFMCKDFPETAVLLKFITDFAQASKTVSLVLTSLCDGLTIMLSVFSSPEPLGSQGELIGWP